MTTEGKVLGLRLPPEDVERFEQVAAHYALTVSAMIRMLVKREHDMFAAPVRSSAAAMQRTQRKGLLERGTAAAREATVKKARPGKGSGA